MHCPDCNKEIPGGKWFCGYCGQRLIPAEPQVSVLAPRKPETEAIDDKAPTRVAMPKAERSPPELAPAPTKAIASLVLGIVSLPMLCCYGCGILPAIMALVLGMMARWEIKESSGAQSGERMALTGTILGGGVIALFALAHCSQVKVFPNLSRAFSSNFGRFFAF